MPKKPKKGAAQVPDTLSLRVYRAATAGEGPKEPVVCAIPPTSPLYTVKSLVDEHASAALGLPRGVIYFGTWSFKVTSPVYTKPDRKLRNLDARKVYDSMWISTLGAQGSSSIVLAYDETCEQCSVVWYLDVPEIPNPRPPLTRAERAAEDVAKHRLVMAAAAGGKKKKKK
mmetsp:Transcript_20339/g.52754  ORF Transcript_20339/g.52754 Transcript_20339/m.52754 type:complete len:171 (-) Transcript_20339:208-720(-)